MKHKYRMNMISGAVLFAFGLVYFVLSWKISAFQQLGAPPIDAKFAPRMWGSILMLLSLLVFLRGIREYHKLKKAGRLQKKVFHIPAAILDHREIILTFLLLFIYILLLQKIGLLMKVLWQYRPETG